MVRKALLLATGISAALIAASPPARAQATAPRVHVTSHSVSATIEPTISLSEPSYVLAIAIDRDGQVSVLSPVSPSDLIRFEPSKSLRLPEFFAGFSRTSSPYYDDGALYRNASRLRYATDDYSLGSVLVIASRTPFNFASISDGPFWNEDAIKKLVRYRDPSSAVYALGRAVSAKGQSFGHDVLRFGADRYRFASIDPCGSPFTGAPYGYASYYGLNGYSGFYGAGAGPVIIPASGTRVGYRLMIAGFDACGRVRYVVVPYTILPPQEPVPVDSGKQAPKPATKTILAAEPGTYTGEAAVRVYEMVKRNTADTYVGVPRMPILQDQGDVAVAGRTVSRDATPPERAESFERVRSSNATPIERATPVLRQAEPQREQPVMHSAPVSQPIIRSEPISQSAGQMQRDSKPVEVVSPTKDN